MEFEGAEGDTVRVSVPTKFVKSWLASHYIDRIITAVARRWPGIETVHIRERDGRAMGERNISAARQN